MIVQSSSARSQLLFGEALDIPPARWISPWPTQLPVSGINPRQIYTGQTEPPLVVRLVGGSSMELDAGEVEIRFSMRGRYVTGMTVDDQLASLSFFDYDPVFSYSWATGDTLTSGPYLGQFRVVRVADGAVMRQDILAINIFQSI